MARIWPHSCCCCCCCHFWCCSCTCQCLWLLLSIVWQRPSPTCAPLQNLATMHMSQLVQCRAQAGLGACDGGWYLGLVAGTASIVHLLC